MSRPEERSEPTEETQEEPEHGSSLHDWVAMIGLEAGSVDKSLIVGADQILATDSGEIFGLRWKYVDFSERSIIVAECSYEGHAAPPKTRASHRKVFVDETVMDSLLRLRPAHTRPDDLVFCTERGTPMNPNNVRNRVLIPACKRAKIPSVGWHNFRYTYSTWANPTGESIKALQAQLGHTDSRLALSVYTQPMPGAQRQLASKIARVLLPIAPNLEAEEEGKGVLIQ